MSAAAITIPARVPSRAPPAESPQSQTGSLKVKIHLPPPTASVPAPKAVLACLVQTKIAVVATPRTPSRAAVTPPAPDAVAEVEIAAHDGEEMDTGAASGSDVTDSVGHSLSAPDSDGEQPTIGGEGVVEGGGEVEKE